LTIVTHRSISLRSSSAVTFLEHDLLPERARPMLRHDARTMSVVPAGLNDTIILTGRSA